MQSWGGPGWHPPEFGATGPEPAEPRVRYSFPSGELGIDLDTEGEGWL
jgi:hypothetical protein